MMHKVSDSELQDLFGFAKANKPPKVTLRDVLENKEKLLEMSKVTEEQIFEIWDESGEKFTMPSSTEIQATRAQKMVFRFRNAGCKASVFYHALDSQSQNDFLTYFKCNLISGSNSTRNSHPLGFMMYDNGLMGALMTFFAWTSNMLGVYNIREINPELVDVWKRNDVEFFFSLKEEHQIQLVNRYTENN